MHKHEKMLINGLWIQYLKEENNLGVSMQTTVIDSSYSCGLSLALSQGNIT